MAEDSCFQRGAFRADAALRKFFATFYLRNVTLAELRVPLNNASATWFRQAAVIASFAVRCCRVVLFRHRQLSCLFHVQPTLPIYIIFVVDFIYHY